MKNAKKIVIVALVLAVLTALAVFCVFAADSIYTGTVAKFSDYVNKTEEAKNAETFDFGAFIEKLENTYDYLDQNPVNPSEEGYADAHALYLSHICIAIDQYLTEAEDASAKTSAIYESVNNAALWLERGFVTYEDCETDAYKERMTRLTAANLILANALNNDIGENIIDEINSDNSQEYISAGARIKALYGCITKKTFDENNATYQTIYANAVELMAAYNAKMEEKRQALIWQASLDEYGTPLAYYSNYDAPGSPVPQEKKPGTDGTLRNIFEIETEILGYDDDGNAITNNYYTVRHTGATEDGAVTSPYIVFPYPTVTEGMIYEFDITTFNELTEDIKFQPYSGSTWMYVTTDGKIGICQADKSTVYAENAITPGSWTHVSYVYNYKDLANCKLYIDYAFVSIGHGDFGNKATAPSNLRMGSAKFVDGEFSIDNVQFTAGTSFRDESFFNGFSREDYFNYFVEYMSSGKDKEYITVLGRASAYVEATEYISFYAEDATEEEYDGSYTVRIPIEETTDPNDYTEETRYYKYKDLGDSITDEMKAKIKASVDVYYSFDAESIILEHKKQNLAELKVLADAIKAQLDVVEPTEAALGKLKAAHLDYQTFTLNNVSYIYDDSADVDSPGIYNYCNEMLGTATERIALEESFISYINAMEAYLSSSALAAMQKNFDKAEAIRESIGSVIEHYITDEYTSRTGYGLLKMHYTDTRLAAPERFALVSKTNTAKKIVDYVNFLTEKYPSVEDWRLEYVDKPENQLTETEKQNNSDFEYIADYLTLIRKQLAMDYDESYVNEDGDSTEFAILKIAPMNEHYFSYLQDKHVAAIEDVLDQASAASSYIEKKGLLAWIERYLVSNEIDFTVSYHCDTCGDATGMLENLSDPACPSCSLSVEVTALSSPRTSLNNALQRYVAYNLELDEQEEGEKELRIQNTDNFIKYMNLLNTTTLTYAEKKAYYDAATPCYDVMNVGSDEAQAAIAIYEAMTVELKAIEDASEKLKDCMLSLDACKTRSATFECLVEATIAKDNCDTSIEGVEEALDKFNAACEDYNGKIEVANKQISQSGYAIGSMASNCDLASIISVIIEKLFNFG